MNAFLLAAAVSPSPLVNGARMPSTADDDWADIRNTRFRSAADLRKGLDCLSFMSHMIRRSWTAKNDVPPVLKAMRNRRRKIYMKTETGGQAT
jgi:hypothetical protein